MLSILELNKYEKMVARGKARPDPRFLRSKQRFMRGIEKGSGRILTHDYRKGGSKWVPKFKKSWLADLQGPISNVVDRTIRLPKTKFGGIGGLMLGKKYKEELPLIKRHEVDELRYGTKIANKHNVIPGITFTKSGSKVGKHFDPKVLKNEKDLVDFTLRAYGVGEGLNALRKKTGEYDIVSQLGDKGMNDIIKKMVKNNRDLEKNAQKELDKFDRSTGIKKAKHFINFLTAFKKISKGYSVDTNIEKS